MRNTKKGVLVNFSHVPILDLKMCSCFILGEHLGLFLIAWLLLLPYVDFT